MVLPTTLTTAEQQTVLATMFAAQPLGSQTDGTGFTQVFTVSNASGASITVGADFGTDLAPAIALALVIEDNVAEADVTAGIQAALETLAASLGLGADLLHLDICEAAAGVTGVRTITTSTINASTDDLVVAGTEVVDTFTLAVTYP